MLAITSASTNLAFLQEKSFSFTITLLIIAVLTAPGVANAYLILGHAHFVMTALYQYKMGRMTPIYFLIYAIAFALIFLTAHTFPKLFTLFVSACLLFHVYTGEVRHIKKSFSLPYLLLTLALVVLLCSWLVIELWGLALPINQILLLVGGMGVAATAFFVYEEGSIYIEYFFITLLVLLGCFIFLEVVGSRPASFESFGFIVIAHYLATYFNVFQSFTKKGLGKQWLFVWESGVVNAIFLVGFIGIFWYWGTDNLLYFFVYQPISFYVWTLMHFITTMNFNAFAETLKLTLPFKLLGGELHDYTSTK